MCAASGAAPGVAAGPRPERGPAAVPWVAGRGRRDPIAGTARGQRTPRSDRRGRIMGNAAAARQLMLAVPARVAGPAVLAARRRTRRVIGPDAQWVIVPNGTLRDQTVCHRIPPPGWGAATM